MQILREALADLVTDQPAPVAFAIQRPKDESNLHVVLDRSGFVMGRTRSVGDGIAILVAHLAAWLRPPSGTARLRMRALLRSDGSSATLAMFPFFTDPPAVERRLDRLGFGLVDRHVVDIDGQGRLQLTPTPWADLVSSDIPGHAALPTEPLPIDRLVIPALGDDTPSRARIVAMVSAEFESVFGMAERVMRAENLVEQARVSAVQFDNRNAIYQALADD